MIACVPSGRSAKWAAAAFPDVYVGRARTAIHTKNPRLAFFRSSLFATSAKRNNPKAAIIPMVGM